MTLTESRENVMHVNAMEAAAGEVRAAHREQCFDAIRRTLGLGDTKGDTGAWLDWIDAVAGSRSADEVVKLTMEQKRIEGTLGSKLPPVDWRKAEVTRRPSPNLLRAAKSILFSADAFGEEDARYVEIPRTEIEALRTAIAQAEGR